MIKIQVNKTQIFSEIHIPMRKASGKSLGKGEAVRQDQYHHKWLHPWSLLASALSWNAQRAAYTVLFLEAYWESAYCIILLHYIPIIALYSL